MIAKPLLGETQNQFAVRLFRRANTFIRKCGEDPKHKAWQPPWPRKSK